MDTRRPILRPRQAVDDLRAANALAGRALARPQRTRTQNLSADGPVVARPNPPVRSHSAPSTVSRAAIDFFEPDSAGVRYSRSDDSQSLLRTQPAVNDLARLRAQQAHGIAVAVRPAMTTPTYAQVEQANEPPPYHESAALAEAFGGADMPPAVPQPRSDTPPGYQPVQPSFQYESATIENYGTGIDLEALADEHLSEFGLQPQ